MFAMFARFNYQSADLDAEERNYLQNHVRLAKQLLGVRMYLTGRLLKTAGTGPDRYRAVLFVFDTPESAASSYNCPAGAELAADSAAHIADTLVDAFDAQTFIPFEPRAPGERCFVMARAFDLNPGPPSDAHKRYHDLQKMIRASGGLRGYLAGQLQPARDQRPDRSLMEIVIFDSRDAFYAAFAGALATAEQSLLQSPRTYLLHARVEI